MPTPITADAALRRDQCLPGKIVRRAAGLLAAGTGPLREVLRLPAGLPDVLLPALHRRQESAAGDQHFGHAQGQLRLAHHAGLPPGRALRGLRGMHAGLPGGHRPAAAESLAGPGGGRELRLPRRRRSARPSRWSAPTRSKTRRTSSNERSPFLCRRCARWSTSGSPLAAAWPARGWSTIGCSTAGSTSAGQLVAGWRGAAAEFDQGIPLSPPRKALRLQAGAEAGRADRDRRCRRPNRS